MHFPKPMDALTNPVQYWLDSAAMQAEMARMGWQIACSVNPFLPEDLFAAEVGMERGLPESKPSPRRRARPAPRTPARAPGAQAAVAKPRTSAKTAAATKPAVARPAPKGAAPKSSAAKTPAPAHADATIGPKRRVTAKKTVTLPPELPPTKSST